MCNNYTELCPELPDPLNGEVTWDDLTDGSIATYSCDTGYQLSGDETRICERGQWTGNEPTCLGMNTIQSNLREKDKSGN